jgi:hypothetical protein
MILFEDPMRRFVPLPYTCTWRSITGEVHVQASDELLLEQCTLLRSAVENGPVTLRSIRAVKEPESRVCPRWQVLLALPLALLSWGETQMYLDLERAELCFVGSRCMVGHVWANAYRELALEAALAELQRRDKHSTAA